MWHCLGVARESVAASEIEALRLRLRSGNLAEALLTPGRDVVLRSGGRHLTRDELRSMAEKVAGGLATEGVTPGDRVALYAASSLDWVIAYLGVQRAGACVVPMNPDYHSAEAGHILSDSDPAFVIADSPRAAIVESLGRRVVPID
jgi:acyl-CoA synthetase (AMP-forming)/AMP-acid ligase II